MDIQRWNAILSRIAPRAADDIDDIAGAFDPRPRGSGRDLFPEMTAALLPETKMKRSDAVCIGLTVAAELPDACDRAMRLTAFAIERDVEIVILAHSDRSGFERFGFRVERVAGDTPVARASCEDQIRRFWNIDLLL